MSIRDIYLENMVLRANRGAGLIAAKDINLKAAFNCGAAEIHLN